MGFDVWSCWKGGLFLEVQVDLHNKYLLVDRCLVYVRFDGLLDFLLFLLIVFDEVFFIGYN